MTSKIMGKWEIPTERRDVLRVKRDFSLVIGVARRLDKRPVTREEIHAWNRQPEIMYKMQKIHQREKKARSDARKEMNTASNNNETEVTNRTPGTSTEEPESEPDVAELGRKDNEEEYEAINLDYSWHNSMVSWRAGDAIQAGSSAAAAAQQADQSGAAADK